VNKNLSCTDDEEFSRFGRHSHFSKYEITTEDEPRQYLCTLPHGNLDSTISIEILTLYVYKAPPTEEEDDDDDEDYDDDEEDNDDDDDNDDNKGSNDAD
jgi:hypothetical protein